MTSDQLHQQWVDTNRALAAALWHSRELGYVTRHVFALRNRSNDLATLHRKAKLREDFEAFLATEGVTA